MRVTFNDREVVNPLLRVLAAGVLAAGAVVMLAFVIFVVAMVILLAPIWVPVSLLMKHYGLNGFHTSREGYLAVDFGINSFRRAA